MGAIIGAARCLFAVSRNRLGLVLDADDEAVDFSAIAFMFSPQQETGLDATKAIPLVEAPMWFVAINTGPTARWTKSVEKTAPNSYGATYSRACRRV